MSPFKALCALFLAFGSPADPNAFTVSRKLFDTRALSHTAASGTGRYDSYLAMNLPFGPAADLRRAIEERFGDKLDHRGEAHVTVVTPTEFSGVLSAVLSMEEIDTWAREARLQRAKLTPLCLGRARLRIKERLESAYFLVLDAPELVRLRERIFARFVERGGEPSRFDPRLFYPHVTLGYTVRDLHFEDGLRKGVNACIAPVRVQ